MSLWSFWDLTLHHRTHCDCEIPWECVPYLSTLEVWSRQGAIQIHVYLTLPYTQHSMLMSAFNRQNQASSQLALINKCLELSEWLALNSFFANKICLACSTWARGQSLAIHPVIIIGTVRSLWNWLWGRYDVPQNIFLVLPIKSAQHT